MDRKRWQAALAALLLVMALGEAGAQQQGQQDARRQQAEQPQPVAEQPPQRVNPEVPMAELIPLLRRLERELDKPFVVDRRLGTRIYLGSYEPNDVTYPVLLSILRNHGFAAFESEGRINIVTEAEIRFAPTPIVQTDNDAIAADEFVTRVVTTTNIEAPQLVPILRPLMSQAAHLSAFMPNKVVMVDRYANIKRITELIRTVDVPRD
jgi:general secretion pathway protein D